MPISIDQFGKAIVDAGLISADELKAFLSKPQVFKAQHRVMERLVAVKLLLPTMVQNEGAINRFHREVKAAAKLARARFTRS